MGVNVMSKEMIKHNIERTGLIDFNGKTRNIFGIAANYIYNEVNPTEIKCTQNQYFKLLVSLDILEKIVDEKIKEGVEK
jgi:hypothetical protein